MTDNRSYLKRAQDLARQRTGHELSDDELVANFSLNGNERRSQILDTIEGEERAADAIGSDTQSLREAGKKMRTIQAMKDAHARLRRLGR
jgi:hypothetical protein